jgi:hypothetical protein
MPRLQPTVLAAFALLCAPTLATAGPPFLTDDPEPVDPGDWELYLASLGQRDDAGRSGTAPHVEVNYGLMPDVQLHAIAPLAYDRPRGEPSHYGYGDTELGMKWRFVHESDGGVPQVGIFPIVELPTGDQDRGLGSGQTQVFLPVWIQKSYGPWTTYGGGGYWINPGAGNRDYGFMGWEIQRQVTGWLTLGGEAFHSTRSTADGASRTGFNLGGICDIGERVHLLVSAGRDFSGPVLGTYYIAAQFTF